MLEEKAKNFRLVPAVIFIYDCSRLFFLIALLTFFFRTGPEFQIIKFPLLVYTSPNAIFPLMSFFLLVRFNNSRTFIPLYITAKSLSLLCMILWIVISLRLVSHSSVFIWAVSLSAADMGTIMGMATAGIMEPVFTEPAFTEPAAITEPVEGGE
jgi:hypothetical protein